MDSMTDEILSQLGGAPMQRMAQHTGIDQTQLAGAVAAALPLLLGALGRNADRPGGAEALYGALGRDHDRRRELRGQPQLRSVSG